MTNNERVLINKKISDSELKRLNKMLKKKGNVITEEYIIKETVRNDKFSEKIKNKFS